MQQVSRMVTDNYNNIFVVFEQFIYDIYLPCLAKVALKIFFILEFMIEKWQPIDWTDLRLQINSICVLFCVCSQSGAGGTGAAWSDENYKKKTNKPQSKLMDFVSDIISVQSECKPNTNALKFINGQIMNAFELPWSV